MDVMQVVIKKGFAEQDRQKVAMMYWDAFSAKLGRVLDGEAAFALIKASLDPDFALCAYTEEGKILGVAGFQTDAGQLMGFGLSEVMAHYGFWGGLRRGVILSLLEREKDPHSLLMDGIFVDAKARGLGIGKELLAAIEQEARSQQKKQIRLDVIDRNTAAKRLYEKVGFHVVGKQNLYFLKNIFGFSSAEQMRKTIFFNVES